MALHVSKPQRTIRSQAQEIKRLEHSIRNKDVELVEAHQLNVQLQALIRGLEKSLEEGSIEPAIKRDSHNSNQPPSLDLPWKKPKRTRSLKKSQA